MTHTSLILKRSSVLCFWGDKPELIVWYSGTTCKKKKKNPLQLPPWPPTPQQDATAFADHQVEMGRFKPSTCSHAGYNYRPLPACLPSQPHPHMHRGSLPLPLPSGCWHPVGRAAWLAVSTCGAFAGRSHVDFVKGKQHHVTPEHQKKKVPAVLQAGEPIRLEEGKTVVTGCLNSLNICWENMKLYMMDSPTAAWHWHWQSLHEDLNADECYEEHNLEIAILKQWEKQDTTPHHSLS